MANARAAARWERRLQARSAWGSWVWCVRWDAGRGMGERREKNEKEKKWGGRGEQERGK